MNTLSSSALRALQCAELKEAAQLLGRGMRDNPANLRAFGIRDADGRSRALTRFFVPVLRGLYQRGLILGAFCDDSLVGVCGMARPGLCQPTPLEKLSVIPSVVLSNSVVAPMRVLKWVGEWARRDLAEPHWHLGPVAVDSHLQGQGIGGAMLAAFCERMDQEQTLSNLETDKFEKVGFYEKFRFGVIEEAAVLGIPNSFMSRSPESHTGYPATSLATTSLKI
jgi:ribosomal protein S18 acetylase RimI-like enzyme